MTKTTISPALKAAMRRSAQFLRPPAERPGHRAFHHLSLASDIESAMAHAIQAGQDGIAFKLLALHSEAHAAFGADVAAAEMAHLDAEIAECDSLLAAAAPARKPRRKCQPTGSPGQRARATTRKRGARSFKI